MCQNKEDYLLLHISKEHDVVCFQVSKRGIEYFLHKLLLFSKFQEVHFKAKDLGFDYVKLKTDEVINEIVFKYESLESKNLILNFESKDKILYIFCSEQGIEDFKESLINLKNYILSDYPEDINYMVEDWGGIGLQHQQIIKNSKVISHFKIYNVVPKKTLDKK